MSTLPRCLGLLKIVLLSTIAFQAVSPKATTYRMTFGSCFKNRSFGMSPSEIFRSVTESNPDSFVWLGDFAYLDNSFMSWTSRKNTLDIVKQRLQESKNDPNYQLLLKSKAEIVAIWDDHDFGINNGDKNFENKHAIRNLFLDVMDVPKDSPRRTNPHGMYFSQFLDKEKRIKLILLDNRFSNDGYTWKD